MDETPRLRYVLTREQLESAQRAYGEAMRAWDAVGRRVVQEADIRQHELRLAELDRQTSEGMIALRRLDRRQLLFTMANALQRVVGAVRRLLGIPLDHRWAACVIVAALMAVPVAMSCVVFRASTTVVLFGWIAVAFGFAGILLFLARPTMITAIAEQRRRIASLIGAAEARVSLHNTQQVNQSDALRTTVEARTRHERYLLAERRLRELEAIVNDQRYHLLHSDWRSLRGIPFEEFLGQVFRLLGYEVRMTRRTGDHGADLILTHGDITIAVQAKGYADPVGPDPIREALMGKNMYRCRYCMAVTNSRFTDAAHVEANCVGCILIAGNQIADLILGVICLPRDTLAVAV